MRRSLQIAAQSLLILSLSLSTSSFARTENSDIPTIQKAGICGMLLSHSVAIFTLATSEYAAVAAASYELFVSRMKVKRVIKKSAQDSSQDFANFDEFKSYEHELAVSKEEWVPTSMGFPRYGSLLTSKSQKGSPDILRHHLTTIVPAPYSEIALKTMDAFLNYDQARKWLIQIHTEVLQLMWDEGLRQEKHLEHQALREYFLDRVLARHVKARGFSICEDGLPHSMITSNVYTFNHYLANAYFFMDWTGTYLEGRKGEPDSLHYARGHGLAMAYAADHVPQFVELIKETGRNYDRYGIWGQMFDNTHSMSTPFWGGFWVSRTKDFFKIRY